MCWTSGVEHALLTDRQADVTSGPHSVIDLPLLWLRQDLVRFSDLWTTVKL